MESDPHRVLEGMAIAAYAVGASQGYIYVRGRVPAGGRPPAKGHQAGQEARPAGQRHLRDAVRLPHRRAHRGRRLRLRRGDGPDGVDRGQARHAAAAAAVSRPRRACGTARRSSTTSRRSPTSPPIIRKGPEWFAGIGTEKSKGTKVFSLTGKVRNTGLIEVPMGTTLRHIVEEMGGGVPDGGQVKAVQTGGPSGGCIPAEHLDTPVDYESLAKLGSIMGSRRHDRHGPDDEHGGGGPLLHGVLHGRVVRQVHPLPRRHRADAPAADADRPEAGDAGRATTGWRSCATWCAHEPVRPGADGAEPGAEHAALLRRRVRGAAAAPEPATATDGRRGRCRSCDGLRPERSRKTDN